MIARPRQMPLQTDRATIAKATRKSPVKIANVSPGAPDYGISIVVPDPSDIDYGAINLITPDPSFIGRALLMPPGSVPNVNADQYTFAAYVSNPMGPTAIFIPNAPGILFADLPNGVLPPTTAPATKPDGKPFTLFDAISSALGNQVGPTPPDGTGNGHS